MEEGVYSHLYQLTSSGVDILRGYLVNNETDSFEPGQMKVFDGDSIQIGGIHEIGPDGFFEITVPDQDAYIIRARSFTGDLPDTSFIRTKRFESIGSQVHDYEMRTIPTDNIRDLPVNPDFPEWDYRENFWQFAYMVLNDGFPLYYTHPWDWDGDDYEYPTLAGRMEVAIVRDYNGNIIDDDDIARMEGVMRSTYENRYGFPGTLDIQVYAGPDSVMTNEIPHEGYFVIVRDPDIPGDANIGTWVNSENFYIYGSRMKISVYWWQSSTFDRVITLEFASGIGCLNPPWMDYWNDKSLFPEGSTLTDLSVNDDKLMYIIKSFKPESLLEIMDYYVDF